MLAGGASVAAVLVGRALPEGRVQALVAAS
jgi:hypothetical protein